MKLLFPLLFQKSYQYLQKINRSRYYMSYFLHSFSFIVPVLWPPIFRQFRRDNIRFLSSLFFRWTMVCLYSLGNLQGSYCYSNDRIDASNLPFRSFSPVWPDSSSYSLQTRIHSLNQFRSFYWNVLFFKSKSTMFFFALVCLAYFCCS